MNKHLKYLAYVLRHKWYVWQEMYQVWRNNPLQVRLLWAGIVHDLSKFSSAEWGPYVDYFHGGPYPERNYGDMRNALDDKYTQGWVQARFDAAWNHHQKCNPHHWQYWVLQRDDGTVEALEIPERYMVEMICDWRGAGRAITGKDDLIKWYAKNRDKIVLHPNTRRRVDYWCAYFESPQAATFQSSPSPKTGCNWGPIVPPWRD